MKLGFYKSLAVVLACLMLQLSGCARVSEFVARPAAAKEAGWVAAQMNFGRLHEQQGRLEKARDVYLEVRDRTRGEEQAAANHRLGIVCGQLGDTDLAKAYFEDALATSTRKSAILNDLGYLLYLQNELDEARYVLERAAAENPSDDRIANNLAMVLGKQGRMEESFALFRRTVGEAEAHANIGYLHALRGEGNHATKQYSRALSLNGELKSAANALSQIADMKGRLDKVKSSEASAPFADTQLAETTPPQQPFDLEAQSAEVQPAAASAVAPQFETNPIQQVKAEQPAPLLETARPQSAGPPQDPQKIIAAICDLQDRPVDPAVISRDLTPYLKHEDKYVRLYAARGLLWIGQQSEPSVSTLLEALNDPQSEVRATAANFLQDVNPKPAVVLQALQGALYDSDPFVRLYAANAIGPSDVTASIATAILRHPDPRARWLATLALVEFAPNRIDTVSALSEALSDEDSRTRAGAATALGRIGSHAASAVPRLKLAAEDSDPTVQQAAREAIAQIRTL